MSKANQIAHIKSQAKVLNRVLGYIAPPDSLFHSGVPIKTPSLQQCLEIISRAYGFNSYKGLESATSDLHGLNKIELSKVLEGVLHKRNPLEEMDIPTAHYFSRRGITNEIDLQYMVMYFEYANAFPGFSDLKPLRNCLKDVWLVDFFEMRDRKSFQYSTNSINTTQMLLNYVIENIHDIPRRVTKPQEEVALSINLRLLFTQNVLTDLQVAGDALTHVYEVFHDAGFRVLMRNWYPQDPQLSYFELHLSKAQYENFLRINELHTLRESVYEQFNKYLKGNGLLKVWNIDKLSGRDLRKYYLLRFYFGCLIGFNPVGFTAGHIAVMEDMTRGIDQCIEVLKPENQNHIMACLQIIHDHIDNINQIVDLPMDSTTTRAYLDRLNDLLFEMKPAVF